MALLNREMRYHQTLAPVYLSELSNTKRQYIDALVALKPLLEGVNGHIIVPGVGGPQEPYRLSKAYSTSGKEQVISIDYNNKVIQSHYFDNLGEKNKHELLVQADVRNLPIPPLSAKLVSFSSVMHEVVSEEVLQHLKEKKSKGLQGELDQDGSIYKPMDKDKVVREQVAKLKEIIAPGGILAIRDFLPELSGNGALIFNSDFSKKFFEAFYQNHSSLYNLEDHYYFGEDGKSVYGSFTNLSEIWWHFRWFWVDQMRRITPTKLLKEFLGEDFEAQGANALRLSKNAKRLNQFDAFLEKNLGEFPIEESLKRYREWMEIYSMSNNGIESPEKYIEILFNGGDSLISNNGNGIEEKWSMSAYAIDDRRDNDLLNSHFSLYSKNGDKMGISPKRLSVFAMRPTHDWAVDKERAFIMTQITDSIIGKNLRIYPEVTKETDLAITTMGS